jgi:hypothetical protein
VFYRLRVSPKKFDSREPLARGISFIRVKDRAEGGTLRLQPNLPSIDAARIRFAVSRSALKFDLTFKRRRKYEEE